MATEQFKQLYAAAWTRDCAILHIVGSLNDKACFGPTPITSIEPLARRLYDAGADFIDAMDAHAKRLQCVPRALQGVVFICPTCRDPYCTGAKAHVRCLVHPSGT